MTSAYDEHWRGQYAQANAAVGSGLPAARTGPVVLLTTARRGRANVMAMSWHTMLEFEPPLVGCVVSNRNYSFSTLRATKECVIAIPTAELAPKVVGCGNVSGRRVDKFAAFGLTPAPAAHVGAPLLAECFANLECKVVDTRMVNSTAFSSLRSCTHGSNPAGRSRAQFTIAAAACSWSRARLSSCPHGRSDVCYRGARPDRSAMTGLPPRSTTRRLPRSRRGLRVGQVGIVAFAQRLLVAMRRYFDEGVIPEGARLVPTSR